MIAQKEYVDKILKTFPTVKTIVIVVSHHRKKHVTFNNYYLTMKTYLSQITTNIKLHTVYRMWCTGKDNAQKNPYYVLAKLIKDAPTHVQ